MTERAGDVPPNAADDAANDATDDAVRTLRSAGLWEGLSLLALVLVAMPLKYFFAFPLAVRVTGMVHGLLFLWFVYALARAHVDRGWSVVTSLRLFVGAIVPFGFLAVDRALRGPLGVSSGVATPAELE